MSTTLTCSGYLYHDAGQRPPATHYRHIDGVIYGTTAEHWLAGVIVERVAVCRPCAQAIDRDAGAVCHERCRPSIAEQDVARAIARHERQLLNRIAQSLLGDVLL